MKVLILPNGLLIDTRTGIVLVATHFVKIRMNSHWCYTIS